MHNHYNSEDEGGSDMPIPSNNNRGGHRHDTTGQVGELRATEQTPLQWATEEQLWLELRGRFRSCVMIYERFDLKTNALSCGEYWGATPSEKYGLLKTAVRKMEREIDRENQT